MPIDKGLFFGEGAVSTQQPGQVTPRQILHGNVERAVIQLTEVEDLDGVGMRQLGDDARLLLEALADLLVGRDVRAEELQRQHLPHPDVLDLEHRAHPAFAQLLLEDVPSVDDAPHPGARERVRGGRHAAKVLPAPGAEVGRVRQTLEALRADERGFQEAASGQAWEPRYSTRQTLRQTGRYGRLEPSFTDLPATTRSMG
jgi:hypothetical protein